MKRLTLILFVGALSFGGNWLYSAYRGIPVPHMQDEFSYLLAADTFAHGRITNPPHPLWEHFETFYVLQQPTYMSNYPPAQGFFMAAGQVLGGHPIYGVWLSAALMCMAICWMLFAWVPPRWALIGGVVSVLQFGVFTYWSQSYWGGAPAALGGALVFGAIPRIFKNQKLRDVIFLGLGIAVLVNSRPFEGILVGLPLGCLALPWKIQWDSVKNRCFLKKIVLPFILILAITAVGVGAYNKAVTGRASVFPYMLYVKNQMAVPLFIWEPLRPMPAFKNPSVRNFERAYINGYYLQKRTWKGFWADVTGDVYRIFKFYFGYVLAIPAAFFLLGFLSKGRGIVKFVLIVLILAGTCAVMTYQAHAHYFSPLTSLAVLLVVMGLRTLAGFFKRSAMSLIFVVIIIQLLINILVDVRPVMLVSYGHLEQGQGVDNFRFYTRDQLIKELTQKGGKHLVLVDNPPHRFYHNDWVYNGADIDKEPIVWARSMDDKKNAELLAYYKDRQVWRITVEGESYPFKKYYQR